jgi:lysyl-tRNA synthetase class I
MTHFINQFLYRVNQIMNTCKLKDRQYNYIKITLICQECGKCEKKKEGDDNLNQIIIVQL